MFRRQSFKYFWFRGGHCNSGEGSCKEDRDCRGHLICGSDNCPSYLPHWWVGAVKSVKTASKLYPTRIEFRSSFQGQWDFLSLIQGQPLPTVVQTSALVPPCANRWSFQSLQSLETQVSNFSNIANRWSSQSLQTLQPGETEISNFANIASRWNRRFQTLHFHNVGHI